MRSCPETDIDPRFLCFDFGQDIFKNYGSHSSSLSSQVPVSSVIVKNNSLNLLWATVGQQSTDSRPSADCWPTVG